MTDPMGLDQAELPGGVSWASVKEALCPGALSVGSIEKHPKILTARGRQEVAVGVSGETARAERRDSVALPGATERAVNKCHRPVLRVLIRLAIFIILIREESVDLSRENGIKIRLPHQTVGDEKSDRGDAEQYRGLGLQAAGAAMNDTGEDLVERKMQRQE